MGKTQQEIKKRVVTRKVHVDGKVYEYKLKAVWMTPEVHSIIKQQSVIEDINMNDIVLKAMNLYLETVE